MVGSVCVGGTHRVAPRVHRGRGSSPSCVLVRQGAQRPQERDVGAESPEPRGLAHTQHRGRRGPECPHVAQARLLLIISIHRAPIMSKNNQQRAGRPAPRSSHKGPK